MLDLPGNMVYNNNVGHSDIAGDRGRGKGIQTPVDWMESTYSQQTAIRLARSGALIRVVAEPDGCAVCRAISSRIYTPSEVPRLPIRGCLNEVCHCRFEAVDPETELAVSQLVERGVHALRAGRQDLARQILQRVITLDETNEMGWLWLSAVVDDAEKITCLEKVLAVNPGNTRARAGLEALHKAGVVRQELEPIAEPAPAPVSPAASADAVVEPVETAAEPAAPAVESPPGLPEEIRLELEMLRAERKVIIEQWADFVALTGALDPEILNMQAQAFLHRIWSLDDQAIEILADGRTAPEDRLQELYAQWRESENIGEALAGVIEQHRQKAVDSSGPRPVREVLRGLAQQVIGRRNMLREQIATAGGQVS